MRLTRSPPLDALLRPIDLPLSFSSVMQGHRRMGRGLQHLTSAFLARLQDTGGLRRQPIRNRPARCAARELRAPAGCSTRAERRINRRGSNRHRMKSQWQVSIK